MRISRCTTCCRPCDGSWPSSTRRKAMPTPKRDCPEVPPVHRGVGGPQGEHRRHGQSPARRPGAD
jgi:hypothetical protein